ncbi:carbohydrate ABC transporter permease [Shimia abyssi]|uniref:Carbohydrate ABC transporter membrane protein 1 (CUT1 family) n=1 Tax=Shimia abyssi TaxID=1662395 RepID=A0A2P8F965_9RHOB|nr:sugar ABC transporter permease [Shimia abyssi]PSL18263.1 carbohydrate ABC transporter membrane protein 1 (CUT1 family) [Shimia abyssi]
MSSATPPTGTGALAKREARLAWALLAPTLVSVSLVVVLPLLAIFWISFKPFSLSDLRPPAPVVRESLRGSGDDLRIEYRLRNSSQDIDVTGVTLSDTLPDGVTATAGVTAPCQLNGRDLFCDFGTLTGGQRERIRVPVTLDGDPDALEQQIEASEPKLTGSGPNILTNLDFSLENYARVFDGSEFWGVFWVTLFYTVFGTIGALLMGLFAALLLNKSFKGQGFIRGLYLFPYVAPVIAVAFTWVALFDPFSGSANALLVQMGLRTDPINFFGERPLALIMVTVFEIWRYFPLSFLFILARMQSIDSSMYEAADMDGASPFQKFWLLSIPQLLGILSVLFLLRFIWTFNKFDDIFLLTGGNAGTRTLTVNVYEQAFAISNIGAGAAVAVVILMCLLVFSFVFFRFISREEGL